MSDTAKEDVKLSLKVMINKEKTKVLFAEVDNDFADVLLSFLSLPLGRIVKLLENHYSDKAPVLGSITSLYKSIANLDDFHFSTAAAKQMLLDPRSSLDSISCKLKLHISDSHPTSYFICQDPCCSGYVYMYRGECSCCGGYVSTEVELKDYKDGRGFALNKSWFMISDELQVIPYCNGFFQTMSSLGITGADGAELRDVTVGTNEIMDLLRCSLLSKTPLTDFILNKREISSSAATPEPAYFLHQIEKKEEETSDSKKIMLKVMVQKSTNKVLFAKAEDDFIDLLSTFLILPISTVESLLESNTCLKNIDNLYKSISDVILDKYFIAPAPDTKKKLMNPNLPHLYKPKITILPLTEDSTTPGSYYYWQYINDDEKIFRFSDRNVQHAQEIFFFKSPKEDENYVRGLTTFMVTDDLTVTEYSMSATFSILNRLKIPFSDVDELELPIGLQEGLSILKASLTSDSALTHGLMINRKMEKQSVNIGF